MSGNLSSAPLNESSSSDSSAADPYREGVQAFLDGNDEASITHLNKALDQNSQNEKAKKLLLKVYVRTIQAKIKIGDSQSAQNLILQSQKYLPFDPQIKSLYGSLTRAPLAEPPPQQAEPVRRVVKKETPKPKRQESAPVYAPPPAHDHEEAVHPPSLKQAPLSSTAQNQPSFFHSNLFIYLLFFVGLVMALFFFFTLQNYRRTLLDQTRLFQETIKKEEAERTALRRDMEAKEEAEKRAAELAKIKRREEEHLHIEMDKLKRNEEKKMFAEIAEKRRQEEEKMKAEWAEKRKTSPGGVPFATSTAAQLDLSLAKRQEEQILGVMGDIPPPERRTSWDRIADQVMSLYTTSADEALQFLKGLAEDKNPWTRASIVASLARIGTTTTLDILFKLLRDPNPDVQREVLRSLKFLLLYEKSPLPEAYRQKITAFLNDEKQKGEWVL